MSTYKAGLGWAGSEDYATPAMCVTDRAGVDVDDIIILCKGYLGRNNVISGSHTFNIYIHTDNAFYDGSNHSDLAYFSGVNVQTTSPLVLRDFATNNDGNAYDTPLSIGSSALNATIEKFLSIRTQLISSYPTLRVDSDSLTNTIRNGIVDANNNGVGLDHRYLDGVNLQYITELNSLNVGINGSNASDCSNSLALNNVGDDFANIQTLTNSGSEDLTGNTTGHTLAELVDPATGNYQVKETSAAWSTSGAFFEAITSSGTHTVTFEKLTLSLLSDNFTASQLITSSLDKNTVNTVMDNLTGYQSLSVNFDKATTALAVDSFTGLQDIAATFDKATVSVTIDNFAIDGGGNHTVTFEKASIALVMGDLTAQQSITANLDKNTVDIAVDNFSASQTVTTSFIPMTLALTMDNLTAWQAIAVTFEQLTVSVTIDNFIVISELLGDFSLKDIMFTLAFDHYAIEIMPESYEFTLNNPQYEVLL
jgi:hypothetical protein